MPLEEALVTRAEASKACRVILQSNRVGIDNAVRVEVKKWFDSQRIGDRAGCLEYSMLSNTICRNVRDDVVENLRDYLSQEGMSRGGDDVPLLVLSSKV